MASKRQACAATIFALKLSRLRADNMNMPAATRPLPSFVVPAAAGLPDPVVEYHEDGLTVASVQYRDGDGDGKLHRDNGPAVVTWHSNGVKAFELWRRHDKLHREGGPAYTVWRANGVKSSEVWYRDGKVHREDGPAHIGWRDNGVKSYERWCRGDKLHREGRPAETTWHDNGVKWYEQWYRDDKLVQPPSLSSNPAASVPIA